MNFLLKLILIISFLLTINLVAYDRIEASKLRCKNEICYAGKSKTPFEGYVVSYYKNGKEHIKYKYKNGKRDGEVIAFDKDGFIMREGYYKDGKPYNGERIEYWPYENTKRFKANYRYGKLDGYFIRWHRNGKKWSKGIYKDGKKYSGKFIRCFNLTGYGVVEFEEDYKYGKRNGKFISWYRDGVNRKKFERNYKKGKLDGKSIEWSTWANDGIVTESIYKKGKLISSKKYREFKEKKVYTKQKKKTNYSNNNTTSDKEPSNMKGITEAHNVVRRSLGIPELKWSTQLASYAQVWANYLARNNNCRMKHRPHYGKYKQIHGENLSWFSPVQWSNGATEIQKISPARAIQGWIDEGKDYNYSRNKCNSGRVCGHYTQLVWAKSKRVGCAKVVCGDKSIIWVCNYDPAGNYIGKRPY